LREGTGPWHPRRPRNINRLWWRNKKGVFIQKQKKKKLGRKIGGTKEAKQPRKLIKERVATFARHGGGGGKKFVNLCRVTGKCRDKS